MEVLEPLSKIPYPKLFLKYIPYPAVYKIAQSQIELHPEFDYIFWHQNDMIITKEMFERMKQDFIDSKLDYMAFSMNVDLSEEGKKQATYTQYEPELRHNFKIRWEPKQNKGIIQAVHSGGPFFIKRTLLLEIPLIGEPITGINADILHCKALREKGIKIMVNTKYDILHLRYMGIMQVGRKTSEIVWTK